MFIINVHSVALLSVTHWVIQKRMATRRNRKTGMKTQSTIEWETRQPKRKNTPMMMPLNMNASMTTKMTKKRRTNWRMIQTHTKVSLRLTSLITVDKCHSPRSVVWACQGVAKSEKAFFASHLKRLGRNSQKSQQQRLNKQTPSFASIRTFPNSEFLSDSYKISCRGMFDIISIICLFPTSEPHKVLLLNSTPTHSTVFSLLLSSPFPIILPLSYSRYPFFYF